MAVTYATLDPARHNSNIALSNANLTATSSAWLPRALSTIGISTSRMFAEFTVINAAGTGIGVSDGVESNLGAYIGQFSSNEAGWFAGYTGIWRGGANPNTYAPQFANGDIVGVGYDADVGELHFWVNGVYHGLAASGLTGTQYIAVSLDTGVSVTANFGETPLQYPQSGWPLGTFISGGIITYYFYA